MKKFNFRVVNYIAVSHIKIAIIAVLVLSVVFNFYKTSMLAYEHKQLKSDGRFIKQKALQIFSLVKQNNISIDALNNDIDFYNQYFKDLTKKYNVKGTTFNFQQDDAYWSLNLNTVSGRKVLLLIDKLAQVGLYAITVTLTEQKDNFGKFNGIVILKNCCISSV